MTDPPTGSVRIRPDTTLDTEFFWRAGHDGVLRVLGCRRCAYLVHPPAPYCPECGSRDVAPREVSGRARVYSFTVIPAAGPGEAPTVLAVVELAEQPGLRLMSNVVGCEAAEVRIDMPLRVLFEPSDDLMIPLFRPGEPS